MDYKIYFENAVKASRLLVGLKQEQINAVLVGVSKALVAESPYILLENQKDLDRMSLEDPKFDRLKLTHSRIADIGKDILRVSELKSPVGTVISTHRAENGLEISKVSVPLGVVGVIYEARPNVTADVFTLCFKTGNVALLKGGSDAEFSSRAIVSIIHKVLKQHGIHPDVAILLPPERAATEALLNAFGFVDVLIPRGSQQLINYVRLNSKIPVIETGAGIVHTYFDFYGDAEKAGPIIFNAKTRRVSVCNSLDCLLVHEGRLGDLVAMLAPLSSEKVLLFADEQSYAVLDGSYPSELLFKALPEHFGTEFLDYKMAVKTVKSLEHAITHIADFSSKHSEAILSENTENIELFLNQVDAAAVYANSSTGFTDGGQFGLGAEIGISTQKLHARGPMGLSELTTYKWVIRGDGQVRA